MKNLHVLLVGYAALVFSTVFGLSLLREERIDVYMTLFVLEFFIASELTSPLTPDLHRRKNIVGMVLLIIFAAIVIKQIAEILW